MIVFKPSGQRYIVEKSKNSFKSAYNQSFEIFAGDKVVELSRFAAVKPFG